MRRGWKPAELDEDTTEQIRTMERALSLLMNRSVAVVVYEAVPAGERGPVRTVKAGKKKPRR